MKDDQLTVLAQKGAELRLAEIYVESVQLLQMFPELRTPETRSRTAIRKLAGRNGATRNGDSPSTPATVEAKSKHHRGLHWTQRPENKARLRKMIGQSVRTRRAKALAGAR